MDTRWPLFSASQPLDALLCLTMLVWEMGGRTAALLAASWFKEAGTERKWITPYYGGGGGKGCWSQGGAGSPRFRGVGSHLLPLFLASRSPKGSGHFLPG